MNRKMKFFVSYFILEFQFSCTVLLFFWRFPFIVGYCGRFLLYPKRAKIIDGLTFLSSVLDYFSQPMAEKQNFFHFCAEIVYYLEFAIELRLPSFECNIRISVSDFCCRFPTFTTLIFVELPAYLRYYFVLTLKI